MREFFIVLGQFIVATVVIGAITGGIVWGVFEVLPPVTSQADIRTEQHAHELDMQAREHAARAALQLDQQCHDEGKTRWTCSRIVEAIDQYTRALDQIMTEPGQQLQRLEKK